MDAAGAVLSASRVQAIRRRMLRWGRKHFAEFPWRHEQEPWISLATEVLLQRTKAKQVVPVYERFQDRYPSAEDLARSSREELLSVVGTLGLHWRAPLMLKMAGVVPIAVGRRRTWKTSRRCQGLARTPLVHTSRSIEGNARSSLTPT